MVLDFLESFLESSKSAEDARARYELEKKIGALIKEVKKEISCIKHFRAQSRN